MPRPPRPLLNGGCYPLIARGNNRQSLFTEAEAFRYCLETCWLGKIGTDFPESPYTGVLDATLLDRSF